MHRMVRTSAGAEVWLPAGGGGPRARKSGKSAGTMRAARASCDQAAQRDGNAETAFVSSGGHNDTP